MPTPAIRQYRKQLWNAPVADIAREGLSACGYVCGLPGFPEFIGDRRAIVVSPPTKPMLAQLADWIDEHGSLSCHPWRDALRIVAGAA